MKHEEILYNLIDLDSREVRILDYEECDDKYLFTLSSKKKSCECPTCHKRTTARQDLRVETNKRPYKHLYFSNGKMVELYLKRRYFRCKKCKKSFMERYYLEPEKGEHTKTFAQFVMYSWGHMSGNQIARNTKCSNQKIHKILQWIDPDIITKEGMKIMEWLDKIYLGIDEHSFRGRDMVLIITELKEKKVLAVLDWITNNILTGWLKDLPDSIKSKIMWLSIDMSRWYKGAVESVIPNIITTIDKYHLFQEANRMVDEVRKLNTRLMKSWFIKAKDIVRYKKVPSHLVEQKKKKMKE